MNEQHTSAAICDGIADGSCIIMDDHEIVYAGPLRTAPTETDGKLVLLSRLDFERFKAHCELSRH